jgi:hypothetical protein
MIYNETGFGGMIVYGCADISTARVYVTAYSVGDVMFNKRKAKHGILEKVVIKEIFASNFFLTKGEFRPLYKDTLNALWNESDLISCTQAKQEVVSYYNFLIAKYQIMKQQCH